MLKIGAKSSRIGRRPAWPQTSLQRSICPQCIQHWHGRELFQRQPQAQLQQKRFAETGVWVGVRGNAKTAKEPKQGAKAKGRKKQKPQQVIKGDRTRVNIVSKPLVNDIIEYLGPEFVQRHKGCDIIDIYPGAGLWSTKLHEALEPRSHILMEPDAALYEPFVKDLLEKPGVTLLPESGIVWRNLANALTKEHLPHQVELALNPSQKPSAATDTAQVAGNHAGEQAVFNLQDLHRDETSEQPAADSVIPRNDTLLVTANLAFYPRRRFGLFDSMSQMVIFQFISSIRASSLFQKYGLIRMLVWIDEADRISLTARSGQRRRRMAVEGELSTDWIDEIASPDNEDKWFMRDRHLDIESCRRVLAKMNAEGIKIPPGRATKLAIEVQRQAAEVSDTAEGRGSGVGNFELDTKATSKLKMARPYLKELAQLEHKFRHVPKTMEDVAKARKVRTAMDFYFDSDASAVKRRKQSKVIAEADQQLLEIEDSGLESVVEPGEDPDEDEYEYKIDAEDEENVMGMVDKQGPEYKRLKQLQFRRNREERTAARMDALVKELDDMTAEHDCATTSEEKAALQHREKKWNDDIAELSSQDRAEFLLYRDNRHIFKQTAPSVVLTEMRHGEIAAMEPLASMHAAKTTRSSNSSLPAMSWDNRNREPLVVDEEEFFPNAGCVLLDIQPKSMHPLLRSMGPGTSRAGDHCELVMQVMLATFAEPVSKAIETVWPGAAAGVLKNCPSLYNAKDGGCPVGGEYGELTTRALNEKQWVEIIDAWMKWPFRPTLSQLVQRVAEDDRQTADDEPNSR